MLQSAKEKTCKEIQEKKVVFMDKKAEIEKIVSWCEKKKKESGRIYIIERNPFADSISWTSRFVFIEIDKPKESANKSSLVYDSTTKQLWEFINNSWRRVDVGFI